MRTWRLEVESPAIVERITREPRLVVVTLHGMLLELAAFAGLPGSRGRHLFVLLSPSLDGGLLAAALDRLGIGHARGTSGRRALRGSRELIRRVGRGEIALIAGDGPSGPRGIVKPGPLRLADVARARVGLLATSSRRSFRLGSWDGARLPLPFARVRLRLALLDPAAAASPERTRLLAEQFLAGHDGSIAIEAPPAPPVSR